PEELVETKRKHLQQLDGKLRSWVSDGELQLEPDLRVSLDQALQEAEQQRASEKPPTSDEARKMRGAAARVVYVDRMGRLGPEDFNTRHRVGFVLSWIGVAFAVGVVWIMLLHALARWRLAEEQRCVALTVIGLLCLWLPLRAYSEWYYNYG